MENTAYQHKHIKVIIQT